VGGLQQEPLADDPVQPLLLAPALGSVGLAVDQADAQHRAAALQRRIGVGRAVVHIQGLGQPAAYDRLAEHVLAGAGVLLVHPAAVHQQARVVVDQQEQLGALGALRARVGHQRPGEHIADPALLGPLGLVAAQHLGGLAAKGGPVKALAAKVGAHGALADHDPMAGTQDVGDVAAERAGCSARSAAASLSSSGWRRTTPASDRLAGRNPSRPRAWWAAIQRSSVPRLSARMVPSGWAWVWAASVPTIRPRSAAVSLGLAGSAVTRKRNKATCSAGSCEPDGPMWAQPPPMRVGIGVPAPANPAARALPRAGWWWRPATRRR
jgi:hypothetical protein